jgi:hypothetical protein
VLEGAKPRDTAVTGADFRGTNLAGARIHFLPIIGSVDGSGPCCLN